VPASALDTAAIISVEQKPAPSAAVVGATTIGKMLEANPDGQTFKQPVDLYIPYDPSLVPAGSDLKNVRVRMAPSGSTAFDSLDATVDSTAHLVHVQTLHFTDFVPVIETSDALFITTTALPDATRGTAYSATLAATGGTPPLGWSLSPGSELPPGLSLATTGTVSGTPTGVGTYGFFVKVADSASHSLQKVISLKVNVETLPTPTVTAVAPTTAEATGANLTLNLTGTNFVDGFQATWDGAGVTTTFTDTTHLTALVPAASVTVGDHRVAVRNTVNGTDSNALAFTVTTATGNLVPTLTSITPSSVEASQTDTQVHIVGDHFVSGSKARIGDTDLATSVSSSTDLDAIVPSSYLAVSGSVNVTVYNPPPGGGVSLTSLTLTVTGTTTNPVPAILDYQPYTVKSGSAAITLTVYTGPNYSYASNGMIRVNGTALTTTVAADGRSASATVPASMLTTPGEAAITFVNPAPGGGTSQISAPLYILGPGICTATTIDLDGDASNGCETDISSGAACVYWVARSGYCYYVRTLEHPTFSYVTTPTQPPTQGITSSSQGIANIFNQQPTNQYPYYQGGPEIWSLVAGDTGNTGQINTTTKDVSFNGGRGAFVSQPIDSGYYCTLPKYKTVCGGKANNL
jgi:hypothetical protein